MRRSWRRTRSVPRNATPIHLQSIPPGDRAISHSSVKVGVVTDLTGPLSVLGIANANVAKMVVDDINSKDGLLGRTLDLPFDHAKIAEGPGGPAQMVPGQQPAR